MVDLAASQFAAFHRLTTEERWLIIRDQIEANAESGRRSIWDKFKRFAALCRRRGWRAIPASLDQIYAYVLYLRAEGRVSVRSLDVYLSAISTVHRWVGVVGFSAHDDITRRLRMAWQRQAAPTESRDTIKAFPASDIFVLLQHGLRALAATPARTFLSVILDTIFFSRADSGHHILLEDLWFEEHLLLFRERRFKGKAVRELRWRVRAFDTRGIPDLPELPSASARGLARRGPSALLSAARRSTPTARFRCPAMVPACRPFSIGLGLHPS